LQDLAACGVLVDGLLGSEELLLEELDGGLVELGAVDDEVLRVRLAGGEDEGEWAWSAGSEAI
jgi:hypothetical protein